MSKHCCGNVGSPSITPPCCGGSNVMRPRSTSAVAPTSTRPRVASVREGGRTMPARTGQQYITGLQERPREVWIDGERVQDVTTHPALRNGVRSVAALYDMQHDPELQQE